MDGDGVRYSFILVMVVLALSLLFGCAMKPGYGIFNQENNSNGTTAMSTTNQSDNCSEIFKKVAGVNSGVSLTICPVSIPSSYLLGYTPQSFILSGGWVAIGGNEARRGHEIGENENYIYFDRFNIEQHLSSTNISQDGTILGKLKEDHIIQINQIVIDTRSIVSTNGCPIVSIVSFTCQTIS